MKIINARSFHCIPVIKEKYFKKIERIFIENKPDAIMLDLEDSIRPENKSLVRKILSLRFNKIRTMCNEYSVLLGIRINDIKTPWYIEDVAFVKQFDFDYIAIPKLESGSEVVDVKKDLENKFPLIMGIETLIGMDNADDILKVFDKDKDVFIIAHEDPCADFGIERPLDLNTINPLTFFILNLLSKAKKYRLTVIDGASREFKSEYMDNFQKECRLEKAWGMNGKISIHPRQINYINKIFDKGNDRERAKKVLKRFDKVKNGSLIITDEIGNMMDNPSFKMYSRILDKE